MNQQVFVPVTDDMIYNHPERIEGPLVPYEAGMECHDWLSVELNPEDDSVIEEMVRKRANEKLAGKSLVSKTRAAKSRTGKKLFTKDSHNLSLVYGAAFRNR